MYLGYYLWLKVLIDWPRTLLDWDILFLIPVEWWGPVLSPVLIALLMCVCAVLAVIRTARGERLNLSLAHLGVITLGGMVALYVFMSKALYVWLLGAYYPGPTNKPVAFDWPLFLVALTLMAVPSLMATWPGRSQRGVASYI